MMAQSKWFIGLAFLHFVLSTGTVRAVGPTNVVSSPDEGSLLAAVAQGGWVGASFNGTLTITNTISITNNVVLDGSGFAATVSGGKAVQLFYVVSGASLTISNLTLANGSCLVTNGPAGTTADGGGIYNDGGMVTLVGCTLTNNAAQSAIVGGLGRGGAIFNNSGTLSLYQSVFSGNSAVGGGNGGSSGEGGSDEGLGGAIYNGNGTVLIAECSVIQNLCESVSELFSTVSSMGGGLFQSSGTVTITNSRFILNQAQGGIGNESAPYFYGPAYGGAVAISGGTLTIAHSQFTNNQATGGAGAYGGGVYCAARCAASDSVFFGNQALGGGEGSFGFPGCGGGVYNDGTLVLNRCSFFANLAEGGEDFASSPGDVGGDGLGAGIFNAAQLAATNCTIALNSAVGGPDNYNLPVARRSGNAIGGGVFNNTGSACVCLNLTIASNNCSSAPGLPPYFLSAGGVLSGCQIANTNGTFDLHNSIIAYSGTNSNAYGPITDDGYNLCSDDSANLASGSSFNNTDPLLGPLGNNGGPTLCLALLRNSPAIDHADPNDFPSTDQRGYVRPFGNGPDIGAYEYGSVLPGADLIASISGNNVVVSFPAFPTNLYRLQWSTNLATWADLSTNGPMTNAMTISQTVSKLAFSHCYWRLLVQ